MSRHQPALRDPTQSGIFRLAQGARIKSVREGLRLTQEAAAERVKISPREYQRWEAPLGQWVFLTWAGRHC